VKTLVNVKYDLRKVYEAVRDRNRESWQENEIRFKRSMERKFETDDKVYFTCFRVFMAGVARMEAARLSETSESIILRSLFVFFVKESGKVPIIYNIFCNVSLQYWKKKLCYLSNNGFER
jgi:hypothetical protein